MSLAQKRAIAANYARKKAYGGSGAYYKKTVRRVPRKKKASPLYRPVITKHGAYGFKEAGQDIGKAIGGALGAGLGYITGMGDYKYNITANSIMGGIYDPPELHNRSDRVVCIRHREYIADISSTTGFHLQSFEINPGLRTTFPWLSQVAEAFEEYRFTGLVFEYKTMCSDFSTTTAGSLGTAIMSTQYNVLSPNFSDKVSMNNYEFSNDSKPSLSFLHPIECKRSLNPVSELFVRTGDVTTGDLRLYDHGNFQIATQGMQNDSGVIGELWATYEVEFYKAKYIQGVGAELFSDHWTNTVGLSGAQPIGTNPVLHSGSNLGTSISGSNINQVLFPPDLSDGNYLVLYQITGTSAACVGPGFTFVNCTALNIWKNDTTSSINNSSTTTPVYIQSFILQITGQDASFTFSTGAQLPTSPTSMDLWISQVNGDISG